MEVEVKGKVKHVGPLLTFGTKGFTKRTVVLEQVHKEGTSLYAVELTGERSMRISEEHTGMDVTVSASIRCRSWDDKKTGETKWFTSLEAQKVEMDEAAQPPAFAEVAMSDVDDDIPF